MLPICCKTLTSYIFQGNPVKIKYKRKHINTSINHLCSASEDSEDPTHLWTPSLYPRPTPPPLHLNKWQLIASQPHMFLVISTCYIALETWCTLVRLKSKYPIRCGRYVCIHYWDPKASVVTSANDSSPHWSMLSCLDVYSLTIYPLKSDIWLPHLMLLF